MSAARYRLPRVGPARAAVLRTGALVAGAALAAGAVLALAPGSAPRAAAAPRMSSASGTARLQQAVMILLDTNAEDASAASRIHAESRAALRYLAALPAVTPAGLITFGDTWHLVLPPTAHEQLTAALARVRPAGRSSTGLGGGLSAATAVLGQAGATARGRLLVLSDGEDLGRHLPVPSVPADVVTWQPDGDDNAAALRALALASGGHTAPPGRAAALAADPPVASAPAPKPEPEPAVKAPAASGSPGLVHSSAGRPAAGSRRHPPLALIAVLASVFIALAAIGLLVAGLLHRGRRSRLLAERVESYGPSQPPERPEGGGTLARAAVGWVARLQSGRTEKRLAERLDLAGIALKPAEWVLLGGIVGVLLAIALTLVTGSFLVGVLGGALLGWLGMRPVVSMRIARRRAAFAEQLPDLLQLVAGSLRAGFSLAQALDTAVREAGKPAGIEFTRALSQARIGVDLTDALQRVADRMDSTDLRWTVMAIRIQREVGGHLAEVLNATVGTMRERAQLRRHVKALSAEGRLSAYILIGLPVAIGGWLFMSSPTYMRPMYTTALGIGMLLAGAVLVGVGALWMRKVIKVEM